MTDRTELVEAALDSLPNGIALLDTDCEIVFWNRAAEAITGHASVDLLARPVPEALEPMLCGARERDREEDAAPETGHGVPVLARHRLGHAVQTILRSLILRDGMGRRIGTAVVFHPAESLDALPRGECGEGSGVE